MERLDDALREITERGQLSASRVRLVVELCLAHAADDARVVSHVFRAHKAAAPPNKLGSLYAIDALSRECRNIVKKQGAAVEKVGSPASMVEKLEVCIERVVDDCIVNGLPEHRDKVRKVVGIWTEAKTFSPAVLSAIAAKLAAAPPPSASASALGSVAGPSSARPPDAQLVEDPQTKAMNAQVAAIIARAKGSSASPGPPTPPMGHAAYSDAHRPSAGPSYAAAAPSPAASTEPNALGALLQQLVAQSTTSNGAVPHSSHSGMSPMPPMPFGHHPPPMRRDRSPSPPFQRNMRPRQHSPSNGGGSGYVRPPLSIGDLSSIKFDPTRPPAWERLHGLWVARCGYSPSHDEMAHFVNDILGIQKPGPGPGSASPPMRGPPSFGNGHGPGGPGGPMRGGPPMDFGPPPPVGIGPPQGPPPRERRQRGGRGRNLGKGGGGAGGPMPPRTQDPVRSRPMPLPPPPSAFDQRNLPDQPMRKWGAPQPPSPAAGSGSPMQPYAGSPPPPSAAFAQSPSQPPSDAAPPAMPLDMAALLASAAAGMASVNSLPARPAFPLGIDGGGEDEAAMEMSRSNSGEGIGEPESAA